MNEKRVPASEESEDPSVPRTRSDVAPKDRAQIGSGASPRHASGLRPAVHIPPAPPIDLEVQELVDDDAWDDESGPTLLDTEAPAGARGDLDDEPEFSHDDFPTRQAIAPMVAPLMDPPRAPEPEPSTPETAPPVFSADATAPMPIAPVRRLVEMADLPEVPEPASRTPSSFSQPYPLPRPITMAGTPLPPPANVRTAFLQSLSPNDDPPLRKLVLVTVISFLSTLLFAAFVAWIVYLVKH